MRILILTSSLYGTASHHLEAIARNKKIEVAMVIFSEGQVNNKKKLYWRKIRKTFKIGLLGVFNGFRMRNWYGKDLDKYVKIDNLEVKCQKLGIAFFRTPAINNPLTSELFQKADAELGLSLGNGYIPKKIFTLPKYGMINLHHELLPEYQNAQSIIWQIYNGSDKTGFTIHQIDEQIDTGSVLLKEEVPVIFRDTLADTVAFTMAELLRRSEAGIVNLLENFEHFWSGARPQKGGKTYTTPSFWQFLKMERQFSKLKKSRKE